MRDTLLSIHIIAITLWFGGSIMMGYLNMGVMKLGRIEASAGLARAETKAGLQFFMPMSIITLLTGVWLVLDNDAYEFSDPFVSFGFLAIISGVILGPTKFMPIGERMADALEARDEAAAAAATKEMMTWSMIQNLLLLIAIVLMVVKP